jgi:sulfate transport system ATP-binding protein
MNKGKIEQHGTPEEVYRTPANAFVYDFLGGANKLNCTIEDGVVHFEGYDVARPDLAGVEGRATAYARSEDLALLAPDQPGIAATVGEVFRAGPAPRVELRLRDGTFIEASFRDAPPVPLDHGAAVSIQPQAFRVFPDT